MRWFRFGEPEYRRVANNADVTRGRVELRGRVEAWTPIRCPIDDEEAVYIHYRARAPGSLSRAYGTLLGPTLDLDIRAHQAVDFMLVDSTGSVRVEVEKGNDLENLHQKLVERHGIELRCECDSIRPGDQIKVFGKIKTLKAQSPHRQFPYRAILKANRIERVDSA